MNNNSIKIYFIVILLLISSLNLIQAQEKTHLPYSIFGIGELAPLGFNRNLALGKTGYALSSGSGLNNVNPASYHSIDSISFFFDVGVSGDIVKYRTSTDKQKAYDGNLHSLAIGFPITRWWKASIGLIPFSTVGYKVNATKAVEGTVNDEYSLALNGYGGLNRFYWGNTISFFERIHAGINLNYTFGSIEKYEIAQYAAFEGSIITKESSFLNNLNADFGLQLDIIKKDKIDFTLGGVFGYETPFYFKKEIKITDELYNVLEDETTYVGKFIYPMNYGGGFSLTLYNKLMITGDYGFYRWSNTESNTTTYKYIDTENFRVGVEFIPSNRTTSSYFEKITYRAGCYMDDYYLRIKGETTKDYGVTCGLSLPLQRNKSSINLTYMRGEFGTKSNGLMEKTYNSFFLSFTLHDWWFIRSKFD